MTRELAPVEAYQNEWELIRFLDLVESMAPKKILEVGAMYGGTLWHWLRIADHVVVVDDEMRMADLWAEWAEAGGANLDLLQGSSQDPALVNAARSEGPYDFIFIDADHRYEAVKADWENFRGMIAPGGAFAFHDTQHVGDPTYGVQRLWGEITSEPDVRWVHIVMTNHCGIGVVWLD